MTSDQQKGLEYMMEAVANLAKPSREQREYLIRHDFPDLADELALEFDAFYPAVRGACDEIGLSPEQLRALDALDAQLARMSGEQNHRLWDMPGALDEPEWEIVRRLAREAMAIMRSRVQAA